LLLSILKSGKISEECAVTNAQHFFFLILHIGSICVMAKSDYWCKKNLLFYFSPLIPVSISLYHKVRLPFTALKFFIKSHFLRLSATL